MKYMKILLALILFGGLTYFGVFSVMSTPKAEASAPINAQSQLEGAYLRVSPTPTPDKQKTRNQCPEAGMGLLCHRVAKGNNGDEEFIKDMERAACVDRVKDSEAEIKEKIRTAWSTHPFVCDNGYMDKPRSNLLKYAVKNTFYDFLEAAVFEWGLDLNKVDADGTTVLDYLDELSQRVEASEIRQELGRYRSLFVSKGAKHARELVPANKGKR